MVEPVKLAVAAQDQAGLLQLGGGVIRRETAHARRRVVRCARIRSAAPMSAAVMDLADRRRGADQQPRAAHRREGHGRQQFRVVLEAMLRVGVGPGEIEHEFAARMRLAVQAAWPPTARRRASSITQMPRRSSRCAARRSRIAPARAGIRGAGTAAPRAGQRIPTRRVDFRDAVEECAPGREVTRGRTRGLTCGSASMLVPDICPHRAPPCSRCRPR